MINLFRSPFSEQEDQPGTKDAAADFHKGHCIEHGLGPYLLLRLFLVGIYCFPLMQARCTYRDQTPEGALNAKDCKDVC